MSWIDEAKTTRRSCSFGIAIVAMAMTASPALAHFPDFDNVIMYMTANGADDACRLAFPGNGWDPSATSGPTDLYRLDPATGQATLIGEIADDNLAGRIVKAGLDTSADPITLQKPGFVELQPGERIVDVCGLSMAGDGRLYGSATLESNGIHVLVQINPDTAQAHLIGSTNVDAGIANAISWNPVTLPDPTLCFVQDLTYEAGRDALMGYAVCILHYEQQVGQGEDLRQAIFSRLDLDWGQGSQRMSSDGNASRKDYPVNPWSGFRNSSIAFRPSTGKYNGITFATNYVAFTGNGSLDTERQFTPEERDALRETLETPSNEPVRVRWKDFFFRFNNATVVPGISTSLAYNAYDDDEPLYRTYLDSTTRESLLDELDPDTGLTIGGPLRIVNASGGAPIAGVQAITFMSYVDLRDQTHNPDLNSLVACPSTPRNATVCNLNTRNKNKSKIKYTTGKGRLYQKSYTGLDQTKADYGDPTEDTSYALCIYGEDEDREGNHSVLIGGRQLPAGENWKEYKTGFRYKAQEPIYTKASLRLKKYHSTRMKIEAKGLDFPTLPVGLQGATVQMIGNHGGCWSSPFPAGTFTQNNYKTFKASRRP